MTLYTFVDLCNARNNKSQTERPLHALDMDVVTMPGDGVLYYT